MALGDKVGHNCAPNLAVTMGENTHKIEDTPAGAVAVVGPRLRVGLLVEAPKLKLNAIMSCSRLLEDKHELYLKLRSCGAPKRDRAALAMKSAAPSQGLQLNGSCRAHASVNGIGQKEFFDLH